MAGPNQFGNEMPPASAVAQEINEYRTVNEESHFRCFPPSSLPGNPRSFWCLIFLT
jgi:hypothetical protein